MSRLSASRQSLCMMLIMLPMWINFLLRTYAWKSILENNGFINQFFRSIGLISFLQSHFGYSLDYIPLINTQGAIVLGMVYNFLPFMVLPIYTVLIKLDRKLIEAAQDLGAPTHLVFRRVIFPLSILRHHDGVRAVRVHVRYLADARQRQESARRRPYRPSVHGRCVQPASRLGHRTRDDHPHLYLYVDHEQMRRQLLRGRRSAAVKKFFKNFYLLLIFLFLYAPIVVLMIFSFNDSKSRRLWNGFTTRWYVELFRDADILHSLYVTLLVAVAAAAIATVLGTIAAIGIHNMGRRAKAAYLTVNNIPMSSSDTIMGVTFMLLFAAIGLDKGYLTLILAHVTFCTPYVVLNVMPKLRQLDKNAYEAALDLGATPHQALHKVILPEIMPGIVTGAIMAFTMSIDDFVVSYFTAGTTSQPLSVVKINAISTILFLIVLALLIVINMRQSRDEKRREAARRKGAMQP